MGLPSGTVAFLFTDIEGSTRQWEAHGDAMRDAVRRHDEIIRAGVERHGGYVFKTIGDAFCVAFSDVFNALEAARDAQAQLRDEAFDAVGGVRVRMAVAAGAADERDGDYFGTPVNRAARLLGAGHGGQVLVAGDAADLAGGRLPAGVTLRALGTVTLRDLREPERVHQLVAADLPSEFRPLRALQTPPNNLPHQATSFVGRAADVIAVVRRLETEPLVTIVGAGGLGKTRLALEAAAELLPDRRDGCWFVDLSLVLDASLVASTILSALKVEQTTDAPALDVLVEHLSERDALLVLDNCEHLIGEASRVVASILQRCPHAGVLATSRAALDVGGESIYTLQSLDLDSARALFDARATAADNRFDPRADRALVDDICRRLDGIALAIELAAARVRTIPIRTLSEHLELRILTGGRDRQPRQQTMRSLIDWSYNLLNPDEQEFLRRCSTCVGGFTLESACALRDGTDFETLELISSLADKSLAIAHVGTASARYRLLEPIRQYALERLEEAGEKHHALHRHAHAYSALSRNAYEEYDCGPSDDWLARNQSELANFRAALSWTVGGARDLELGALLAANTSVIFLRLSLSSEGISWCTAALEEGRTHSGSVEARLRYGMSMLYNNQGANADALSEAHAAAALYREAGDPRGLARALSQVANHEARQERFEPARVAADEALALARESGDRRLLADVLRRCARAFTGEGDEAVRQMYAQSLELLRALERDDETALALSWWGQWEATIKNYVAGADLLSEAKRIAAADVALGVDSDIIACYLSIGDMSNALAVAKQYLEVAANARHPVDMPFAVAYAAAMGAVQDPVIAATLAGYAQGRLARLGWKPVAYDRAIASTLDQTLRARLPEADLSRLVRSGEGLTDEEAVSRAAELIGKL